MQLLKIIYYLDKNHDSKCVFSSFPSQEIWAKNYHHEKNTKIRIKLTRKKLSYRIIQNAGTNIRCHTNRYYYSLSLLNKVLLLATHSFQLNLKSTIENIYFLLNQTHIFFLTKYTNKSYSFPRKVQHQKHIEVCHFIKF